MTLQFSFATSCANGPLTDVLESPDRMVEVTLAP